MTLLVERTSAAISDLDMYPSAAGEWAKKQMLGVKIHDFVNSTGGENETWQMMDVAQYEPREMPEDNLLAKLIYSDFVKQILFSPQIIGISDACFLSNVNMLQHVIKKDQPKAISCIRESEEDMVDWDFHVESPPPRQKGTIKVHFHCKGRGKPLPVDDPWE